MTIDELLKSMLTLKDEIETTVKTLENNKETWSRIGSRDDFNELTFESEHDKEAFLKEWINDNDYSNI